jgi:hypothetical protein
MSTALRNVRSQGDCVAKLRRSRLQSLVMNFSRPLVCALACVGWGAYSGVSMRGKQLQRWRGTAEKLGQPPQILRRCCEQHFVSGTTQAPQPKSVA